jgi:hypothetical protein
MSGANEPEMKLLAGRGGVTTKLDPRLIDQALANAGYGLPRLFTDSASVRLGLAELSDQALDWSSREDAATSRHPGASTNFTRNVAHFIRDTKRHGRRGYYATKLSAIFEREVRPGSFQHWRIHFNGDDGMVALPKVYLKHIDRPSFDPQKPGDSKTTASSAEPVKISPALLNELTAGILDTMVELDV